MMNNFNPTTLETAFKTTMATIFGTTKVYNSRPKANITESEFIVARLASDIADMAAFGECYVEVSIFVKDVNSVKNSARLGVLYNKLVASMPAVVGNCLVDREAKILADVPDDFGFTARIINFKTTIKR